MASTIVRRMIYIAVLFILSSPVFAEGRQALDGFEFSWDAASESEARALMVDAKRHKEKVYGELGADMSQTVRVVVAESRSAMLAQAEEDHGSRPPEWAAGLAYPRKGSIYLHADVHIDELVETFVHELSHVALGRVADERPIPRWFSEGLAIWQSETLSWDRIRLLTEAASMNRLFRLEQLSRGFPVNAHRAGIAYAQAVHFVGYLHQLGGAAVFRQFIARLRDGKYSFRSALEATYQEPLNVLEQNWLSSLRVQWGWVSVIFNENTLWIFASFLLIIGWRRRLKEKEQRLLLLRRLEEQVSAKRDDSPRSDIGEAGMLGSHDGQPPTYH